MRITDSFRNENEGYIVAPAIAAGKKDSENRFSGIMLGDWSNTNAADDITRQTGIYGFHEGAVSFAFKEDGTGFIGKSGHGRINFDGNSSRITSNRFESNLGGLMLDFNVGLIEMYEPEKTHDKDKSIILDAGAASYPFTIGTNFSVDWNGTLNATNGVFEGKITAKSGTIGGWKIDESTLSSDKNNLILDSSDGSITGGILRGSTKINGKATPAMYLDGHFTLLDNNNTYLGAVSANFSDPELEGKGFGLAYFDGETEALIKATSSNVGISYANNVHNKNKKGGYITINEDGFILIGSDTGIKFNISADNQEGIYARFA